MGKISDESREIRLARARLTATKKTIRLLVFVRGSFVLISAILMTAVLGSLHQLNLPLVFAGSLVGVAIFTVLITPVKSIWLSNFGLACQTEQLWDDAENVAMDEAEVQINQILEGGYPQTPFPGLRLKVAQMQVMLIRKGDLKGAARLAEYLYRESREESKEYKANGLACIYLELGKYERGFELLETALTQIESNERSNSPGHVIALLGLAKGNIELERIAEAEKYLERLKTVTQACHAQKGTNTTDEYVKMAAANPSIEMAFYWYHLSRLRELQGSDEAESALSGAIEIMKDPALRKMLVLFYPELMLASATLALGKNDFVKAETKAREAMEIFENDTPS
jgi:tetratricopeptide (TPR) repeat protein